MKKWWYTLILFVLCVTCCSLELQVQAATAENGCVAVELKDGKAVLMDSQGEIKAEMESAAQDEGDYEFTVTPGQTYYLCMGTPDSSTSLLWCEATPSSLTAESVKAGELADSGLFRLQNKKSGSGAGLISVAQYNEKVIGDSERSAWLQVVVANTTSTEELKAVCDLTFIARRSDEKSRYQEGDFATMSLTFWIQAPEVRTDGQADVEANEVIAYTPKENAPNEMLWDDVAKLTFVADEDAASFDATLSTEGEPYWRLGDFSDAELFIRDFTGSPDIASKSRAVLTLYNPWEARQDTLPPEPASCRIYLRDSNENLTDITALFTYLEDENGLDGWQMKTRSLGCYILSDRELNLEGRRTKMAGAFTGETEDEVSDNALQQQPLEDESHVVGETAETSAADDQKESDTRELTEIIGTNPYLTMPYPKSVPNTGD